MNRPLLSICIPTYNRADYLKNCLDCLALQCSNEAIKNQVEVVISDNASEDGTRELVKNYQGKFGNLAYARNRINIGMDGNIINSILEAQGKYCWSIGDDDLIQNGALAFAVGILRQQEVALLTVGFYPLVDLPKAMEEKKFIGNIVTENSAEAFYDKGYYQGIFGIAIFNKEEWTRVGIKNLEPYWGYYEIILKMMGTTNLPLVHAAHPLAHIGQDYRWNKGGAALPVRIHCKRMLQKLAGFGYSQTFIQKEVDIVGHSLTATVLSAKSFGLAPSMENLRLVWKEFTDYPGQLLMTTFIFFIPNFFIKAVKLVKQRFDDSNRR